MADIWVLGTSMHKDKSGPLVRADVITRLMASTEKVTASQIGSQRAVGLVSLSRLGDLDGLTGRPPCRTPGA